MNLSVVRSRSSRLAIFLRAQLLLLAVLLWPALAFAQVSPYCPTQSLTVANGGSVTSIDLINCDGPFNFGMGGPFAPFLPTNGSIVLSPQSGPGNQTVTYTHNGSATTTDTFAIEDENGDELFFNVTITPPASAIVVSPVSLPTLTAGAAFSQTLTSTGGASPYVYSLSGGLLPPGLSLSSAGVLSGAPTQRGGYSFQVRSQDDGGDFVNKGYTGTVENPSLALVPAAATAIQGAPFSLTLAAAGGVSPYTYLYESGTFPAGISLSGGVVSGTTAAAPGNYLVTLRVTESSTGLGSYFELETLTLTVSPPPSVSIAVSAPVNEDGAANLTYTVTRSSALSSPTVVNLTTGGTATAGTDYTGNVATVTIPAGLASATVVIDPAVDSTVEPDETVILTVAAGTGYTVGAPSSATGTILNDDLALPTLAINDAFITEGDAGTNTATFIVGLSAVAGPGGVTFDIATANGTATAGVDYVANSLTSQTILAGSTAYTFTVQVNGDTLNEANETFLVNITNVTNAVVGDSQGQGLIINNDPAPTASINDVTVFEGDSGIVSAVFTISLSAASGQAVLVDLVTADGTAVAPGDYGSQSGTLVFAPGDTTLTFSVPVIGDTTPEPNENFTLELINAINATITDDTGLGTITNDDVPVSVNPVTVPNGTVGIAYSQVITGGGGAAPYSFAITAGALPAGLTLSPGGTLSGTPTAGGAFNFTITATDSSVAPGPYSGSRAYILAIAPATVVLPATPLADGTLGTAYSASITAASGGTAPYAYAVTAGALPGGLALNATTGAITGTPGALGTFNFSVTATDASTGTGPYSTTQNYVIEVVDVPPVANPVSITVPYNAPATNVPLSLTGGAPTSIIGTAASNGSATTSGITVSYQPNAGYAGPDSFTYIAVNSGGASAPALVSVTVSDPIVTITAAGGLAATVATPYTQTFTFNGGAQPWSGYQVTNLPAGVAITGTTANSVTVSGTPTQAGTLNLNVSATDSSTGNGPYTVGQSFTLTVAGPTLALAPAGTTFSAPYGAAFSQAFTASGGVGPYTYVRTGSLPAGVTFSGDALSGTPTAPGSYSFTITATDTGSTGTGAPFTVAQNYTLDVPTPTIVVNPAVLTNPDAGVAYSATLSATGGIGPYGFGITAGTLPAGLTLSAGGTLAGTTNEVGTFNVTVTANDANGQPGSRAYSLTVVAPTLTLDPGPGTLAAPYGVAYSQAFTAGGSAGPFNYTVTGALPAGVTFSGNALSGTPTVPGNYPITVTATDTVLTGVGAPFSIAQNYTLDVPAPTIVVSPAVLANPDAGVAYSATLSATGGVGPYGFTVTTGSLPTGLTLSTGGTLAGTTNAVGTFNFTIAATDANGQAGSRAYSLTIAAPVLTMNPAPGTLAAPYGVPYAQAFTAGGSAGPFNYVVTGALPAGVTFSGNTLSGTPTVPGNYPITVTATDTVLTGVGAPFSIAQNYTLDVAAPTIEVDPLTLTNPAAGIAYSATLFASGGVGPYAFSVTAGTLPTGLTLSGGGTLAGTTNEVGSFNFTITATDANGQTGARGYTVTVAAPLLTLSPAAGTLNAPYGTAYSQVFTAGGSAGPFNYVLTGALPAGVTFSGNTLSGTPTAPGSYPITVTATDTVLTGVGAPFSITQSYTLEVPAPIIVVDPATLSDPDAGIAYSATLSATGGIGPYGFSVTAGSLPTGLTLSGGGTLAGTTNEVGTFNVTVTAADANGQTGSRAYTLAVAAPTLTLDPAPGALEAPYGVAYSQAFTAGGSAGPFDYVLAGTLPAGVTFSGNTLSGTPTAPGSYPITVTATDTVLTGVGAPFSISQSYTLEVPAPVIVLDPATLTSPDAGLAYNQLISASGGVGPYGFTVTAGMLPGGITLSGSGTLAGTTNEVGTFDFTVTATDANGQTGARTYTVTVAAPVLTLSPAAGTLEAPYGAAYSQAFTAGGSAGPFDYVLAGTLPAGVTFSGNTLSGTPTAPGSYPITVTATDTAVTGVGAPFSITQSYTLEVPAPIIVLDPATLTPPEAGLAYSEVISASGGVGPYGFAVTAGTLPGGITLSASGTLSGATNEVGTFNFTVTATDANGQTGARAYTVTLAAPVLTLSPAAGTLNAPYGAAYSRAFTAGGSAGPFNYALTGALPAGVTFSGNTLSGTPTAPGSYPITVTATDTVLTGMGAPFSITQSYTLDVAAPTIVVGPATLADGIASQAYSAALSANGGVGPYGFAVTAGALPAGVTLSSTGTLSGTPTESGTFNFSATATDANGQAGSLAYTLTVAAPALTLAPATVPQGTVGVAYSQAFSTTGGIAPYGYTVSAGALPGGLTLSAGGTLAGTPTTAGSFGFTVTSTDSTGGTAASVAQAYTVEIINAAPVAVNDTATVLAGQAVTIAVTGNDVSIAPITGISIASPPTQGTAVVSGLDIIYTAPATSSPTVSFTYIATGPGGNSAPATVTVTVNPRPVAPALTATTGPAEPVQVVLTNGAAGGPFTGASVVAVSPAGSGATSIAASGGSYVLTFTPASGFSGVAVVRYTLNNAFATSTEGTVTITVQPRPDPSLDAEVRGLVDAQVESSRRFANSQINNFQQRLERLHRGGEGGFYNGIGFAIDRPCIEPLVGYSIDPCNPATNGFGGGYGMGNAASATGSTGGTGHGGPVGTWIGGMIRSGAQDGRNGGADIDFETDGLSTGIDYRISDAFVIGAGFGYGKDENAIGNDGSRVDGDARAVAVYASYHPGRWYLDALLGYQSLDYDLRRYVTATDGLVNGKRDGSQAFASVSVGADIVRDNMLLTPYARLDVAQARLDAYSEAGDPIYALSFDEMDVDTTTGNLGMRVDWQLDQAWGRFTPQLRLEYQHDFSGRSDAVIRYTDLVGGPVYGLSSTGFDNNRFMVGLAALFDLNSGWGWRLEYRGQVGSSGESDNGVGVSVQKQF